MESRRFVPILVSAPATVPDQPDDDTGVASPVASPFASLVTSVTPPDGIPLPGKGQTLQRWRLLSGIAAAHGAVAIKRFEAHADALAILAEIAQAVPAAGTTWAVWAAEPPDAQVQMRVTGIGARDALCASAGLGGRAAERALPVRLQGRTAWCPGARDVSHALVTCEDEHGAARLAVVALRAASVRVTEEGWHAVGMGPTASGDVLFDDCEALCIGGPGIYIDRPGFWHGGAGIAACWYGAVLPLAHAVRESVRRRQDPHAAAHLAAIDGDLHAAAALLRETAGWIDAHPCQDAFVPAMRVRAVVEAAVQRVMQRAGNVLGAGPLCRDETLARLYADLPVFLRQSHAERDLAAIGLRLACEGAEGAAAAGRPEAGLAL